MTSYIELEQQAAELMEQAKAMRNDERKNVVSQVKALVAEWNMTAEELGLAKKNRQKLPAKYRHPETGRTWSGRGRVPSWLSQECANGYTKEQFLVA